MGRLIEMLEDICRADPRCGELGELVARAERERAFADMVRAFEETLTGSGGDGDDNG